HKLLSMDLPNLCEFCCGLIFLQNEEFGFYRNYRTLKELCRSVQRTTCPFCKAFYDSLLAERPNAEDGSRCKFDLQSNHDGFILLTISFCRTLFGAQNSNELVLDWWDGDGRTTYLENICHWVIAYAESKLFSQ
ncbi:MAG: hypothetical protein JWP58_4673, partial [Hymenobacter sp.]|nr:hypothetical protein [Hymenobacter sp.]